MSRVALKVVDIKISVNFPTTSVFLTGTATVPQISGFYKLDGILWKVGARRSELN